MRLALAPIVLCGLSSCAALVEPRTLQDGDAARTCGLAAAEYERSQKRIGHPIPTEPVIIREQVSLSGVAGSVRLVCTLDFQTRRLTSATVDGVERVRTPQAF